MSALAPALPSLSAAPSVPGAPMLPTSLPSGLNLSAIPGAGNVPAQLAQGQALLSQAQSAISSGDPNAIGALLSAGVTLASGQTASVVGSLVRFAMTVGGGALAGSAGGPVGAVVGAVAGAVEAALQGVFGGGVAKATVSYPSASATEIYKLNVQWSGLAGHMGGETQNPQGWTLCDYLAAKYPIRLSKYSIKTRSLLLLDNISQSAWLDMGNTGPAPVGYAPDDLAEAQLVGQARASALSAPPLCTPVFWLWAQSSEIADCSHNQYNVSPLPLPQLWTLWQNDSGGLDFTGPGGKMTVAMIMARAEAFRPDPFFWSSALYWFDGKENYTFGNLETLNGMAAWLGLLAVGTRMKGIANELLLQQKMIHDETGTIPPLFRLLVEEALAKARVEEYGRPAAPDVAAAQRAVDGWVRHYGTVPAGQQR
jgi:hypothetical protein